MKTFRKYTIVYVIILLLLAACVPTATPKAATATTVRTTVPTNTLIPTSTPTETSTPTPTVTPTPNPTPTPAVAYRIGVDYGPFTEPGQNPELGTIITIEQMKAQLDVIGPYVEWIRTYGCQGLSDLVPLAHERGLKSALGGWLNRDLEANERELTCLIDTATRYSPEMVIVGSETLLRGDLTAKQLVEYLQRVKEALPGVSLVTTADVSDSFFNNETVITETDALLVNIYPYWAGVSVRNSILWLNTQYNRVVSRAQHKQVFISETGWPSCGNTIKNAIPSEANASEYFVNFVSWAKQEEVPYFYFSSFDEPWKGTVEKPQEACWGLWGSSGMKKGMEQVFEGVTVPDNWSPTQIPIPPATPTPAGPPGIYIDSYPALGKYGAMAGHVSGIDPSKYMVACYIYVNGWWTKPTWDHPLTPINANKTWECYVTTGGLDPQATQLLAFLLPKGVNAPRADGGGYPGLGDYPSISVNR
ncbi:MAG: glycosyl hydrolase family 17 protein [Candidatus Gottesmanbacteria bacterium]